jgi:hypothetical protein
MGDRPIGKIVLIQDNTNTDTPRLRVGFELMILAFEWSKTVHVPYCLTILICKKTLKAAYSDKIVYN